MMCGFFYNEENLKLCYSGYGLCDAISKPGITVWGDVVSNIEILSVNLVLANDGN